MGEVICQSCGNTVRDTARFCPRCGGTVGTWSPPSAVESWPPQPQAAPPQPQPQPDPYGQQPYQPDPYGQQPYQQQNPYYQQNPYQQPQMQPFYGNTPPQQPMVNYPVERKDKTVAVLLAVFLGFWTWIYTYKKDTWKFWLCLGLHLTLFNPLWTWLLAFLPNLALHIWAVIDTAVKPQQFYDYYPNG